MRSSSHVERWLQDQIDELKRGTQEAANTAYDRGAAYRSWITRLAQLIHELGPRGGVESLRARQAALAGYTPTCPPYRVSPCSVTSV